MRNFSFYKSCKLKKKISTMSGYKFEKECILKLKLSIIETNLNCCYFLKEPNLNFIIKEKSSFFKFFEQTKSEKPHGCKEPDLVLIFTNVIFILEFKFQNQSGSVSEKLQTANFKQSFYSNRFLNFKVMYVYILSPWFKNNCGFELNYLKKSGIIFFFSSDSWVESLIIVVKQNVT